MAHDSPHPTSSGSESLRVTGEVQDGLPPVLTTKQVTDLFGVCRQTLYVMIREGKLPGVRQFGNSYRFHRDTILRWLEQGDSARPRRQPKSRRR